jgi:ribosomal-protein-alanine N-acetyltransferase
MSDRLPYLVELMTIDDLDEVVEIEQAAFSLPWPARSYRYEITENEYSTLLVVRSNSRAGHWLKRYLRSTVSWAVCLRTGQAASSAVPRFGGEHNPVLGYAGFWMLVDDAHIATIAVHPQWRGRGLGELLLLSLLEHAAKTDAVRATLEVRVSNHVARDLYSKYGFAIVSRRKHYYADNNEDAYLMATPPFEAPEFRANLSDRRTRLYARLRAERAEHANQAVTSTRRPVRLDKTRQMR